MAPLLPSADRPAKLVDPATGQVTDATSVTVTKDGKEVGTYTIEPITGKVIFQPKADFVGEAPKVTIQLEDEYGNVAESFYTPTVTPITTSSAPAESLGMVGEAQKGKPTFRAEGEEGSTFDESDLASKSYVFDNGETTKTVAGEGKYTIDSTTGEVTFEPELSFTGKATPVTVVEKLTVVGDDGKEGIIETPATYTPEVVNLVPHAHDTTSSGYQGEVQTIDSTHVKELFTAGREDDEYNPGIHGGDLNTEEKEAINEDSIKLLDETGLPVARGTEVPAKDVKGNVVGKYVMNEDLSITFTPNKDYTGEPDVQPARIEGRDLSGDRVVATYTPDVAAVVPIGEPKTTSGKQGQVQTQDALTMFRPENDKVPLDRDSLVILTADELPTTGAVAYDLEGNNVGFFELGKDGVITFTPNANYDGTIPVHPLYVQMRDANGTKVTTTYTPVVTPLVPTGEEAKTSGKQVQTQEGSPVFTPGAEEVPMDETVPATFEDGTTEKVVPGEGTYTVSPEGKVTFVPEKNFVGEGSGVVVKRVDKNGTPATAKYTPTVEPLKTTFVDENGNPIAPEKDGTQPKVDVTNYVFTGTTTDGDGNTIHTYRKLTTTYVDEAGNELSPAKDGNHPSENIPGYELVSSTDKAGNTTKSATSYVDLDGNLLLSTVDGVNPPAIISGYELVGSRTDENGNTIHSYRKVVPATDTATEVFSDSPVPQYLDVAKELPNTGSEETAVTTVAGLGMLLAGFGLTGSRRRKED